MKFPRRTGARREASARRLLSVYKRLRTLPVQDARLTLQILPLVIGVRWKLWRTPFPRLQQFWKERVQREFNRATTSTSKHTFPFSLAEPSQEQALKNEVWRCAHAVARAARLVPQASCLTQAMTLQFVLAQRGQPCQIYIGVAHGKASDTLTSEGHTPTTPLPASTLPSQFQAHAWVEWNEKVVLGGDVRRWKRLAVFG